MSEFLSGRKDRTQFYRDDQFASDVSGKDRLKQSRMFPYDRPNRLTKHSTKNETDAKTKSTKNNPIITCTPIKQQTNMVLRILSVSALFEVPNHTYR